MAERATPRYACCAVHALPEFVDKKLAKADPVPFTGRPKSTPESALWRLNAGKPDTAIEKAEVLLPAASILSDESDRAMYPGDAGSGTLSRVRDNPRTKGVPGDAAAEYSWREMLVRDAVTRDTASTSCVREYVPGPQLNGLADWNVNDTAYCVLEPMVVTLLADVNTGADLPRVPSNTTRPVKDNEGVCVCVSEGVCEDV